MKYKLVILIICTLLLIASLLSNGILIYNLMNVKKSQTSLQEENALLEEQLLDSEVTPDQEVSDSESEESLEVNDDNPTITPHAYTIKYKSSSTNAEEVFNNLAEDIPYPVMYIQGSSINESPSYTYVDYGKEESFTDYDFFRLEVKFVTSNNVHILSRQGGLSMGGVCHESYDITTSQGPAHVCKYKDRFTISLQRDLQLENTYRNKLDYVFSLEGNYGKDDIEDLFTDIKIIS